MPSFMRQLALLLALLLVSAPAAADLTLDAASGWIIDAQVNGVPVRLRVDPSAPGYIILNPGAVRRIGLRESMTRAQTFVGPVRLRGSTKAADVALGGGVSERRLLWWDRDVVNGADGIVSMADLPYDAVTLSLAEPRPSERLLRLPMTFERNSGLIHRLSLDGQEIIVTISLNKPQSMATAAAGGLIARHHEGTWAGEARQQPISFGVERPVRPLALGHPLPLAGLAVREMLVRTRDNRGNVDLPPEAGADPDEVVVTAQSGRQRSRYILTLGRDWLSACSSIIWDNRTRIMTLNCA